MPEVRAGGHIGTVFARSQFALDKAMPSVAEVAVFPSGIDNPGELRAANVPFIDGSRRAFDGTSILRLFDEIFQRASAGPASHARDIILPYEYPPLFSKRGRNRQYDGGDGGG